MTYRTSWRAFALFLALALVAVACGGDDGRSGITTIATTAATQAPSDASGPTGEASGPGASASGAFGLDPVDPLSVSGDIAVAGSSTVFPVGGGDGSPVRG